jgi:hypothetical protein
VQEVAAAAAQRQQLLTVPFTSLIVDASIYSGDVTPDTWEWGDLWAVSAAPLLRPHDLCDFLLLLPAREQDYGAAPTALMVNENAFSLSISPSATQVRLPHMCCEYL